MEKRLSCLCLVALMLLFNVRDAWATGAMSNSDTLAPPIRERILYGEDKSPVFDALLHPEDGKGHMEEKYVTALKYNSGLISMPENYPELEEQDMYFRDETAAKDGQSFSKLNMVVRVRFDAGNSTDSFEPAVKWLAVGAPYGSLPSPLGGGMFVGWFTEPDGGERIDSFSIAIQGGDDGNKTLYAHWAFNDVRENSTFCAPIYWAVQNRITKGTSATQFSPSAQCTRKQIIIFLWRAATQPSDDNANNFSAAMEWAYQNGILSKSDRNFDKEAPCTRMEAMTYLWKQCGQPSLGTEETKVALGAFSDVNADDAYAVAVAWAVKNGITKGTSDITFSPNNTCTRGQIVTFLYRAYTDNLLAMG